MVQPSERREKMPLALCGCVSITVAVAKGQQRMTSISVKTPDYIIIIVHGFRPETENCDLDKNGDMQKHISSEE